jgi:phosphoglycolate phosphatase
VYSKHYVNKFDLTEIREKAAFNMPNLQTAVIFDLDGTLLDTIDDLADSMNHVLQESELPEHPVEAYFRFIGNGMAKLVERALPEEFRVDAGQLATFTEAFRVAYEARWNQKSKPYDGIPEVLDALVAAKIPLAVCSNKPDPFTQKCVAQLLPKWDFARVQGHSDAFPRKPDPASTIDIARELAIAPADAWFIGDSDVDMQTAVAAGTKAVGVLWGFRSESELRAAGAAHIVATPGELLNLLTI